MTPIIVELINLDAEGNRVATGHTGIVVSEHLIPVPDQSSSTGLRFQATLGVCWDDHRSPAVSYHSPEELEWIEVVGVDSEDADEDESAIEYDENDPQLIADL